MWTKVSGQPPENEVPVWATSIGNTGSLDDSVYSRMHTFNQVAEGLLGNDSTFVAKDRSEMWVGLV